MITLGKHCMVQEDLWDNELDKISSLCYLPCVHLSHAKRKKED